MFQCIRQPRCLRLRRLPATRRQAVIPAALVVVRSAGPLVLSKLGDQALLEHPLHGAVQRPGAQPQLSTRSGRDVLHNCIAVLVASSQRNEDVKDLGREWQQVRYLSLSIRAHTPKYTAPQYNVNRYRLPPCSVGQPILAAAGSWSFYISRRFAPIVGQALPPANHRALDQCHSRGFAARLALTGLDPHSEPCGPVPLHRAHDG